MNRNAIAPAGEINRRSFLQHAAFASSCAVAGSLIVQRAQAIEPIQRHSGAKFKFSLAAYSYRSLLSGDKPQLTLDDFLDDCAKMQLDGAELTSYYFPPNPTQEFLNGLSSKAFRLGLSISGTAVGNDFCVPAGPERDPQIQLVQKWVDHAATLGAPVIRIFSGNAHPGQSADDAHRLAVEAIEQCCEYAGQRGVMLALENHGGLTATSTGMLQLVRDVKSPWFGVNFDSGNFRTQDPYADLAKIAPYAVNVQIKVMMSPAGKPPHKTDYKRLAAMLSDVGYRGYIVLEHEENEDPREACPQHLEEIRAAFV